MSVADVLPVGPRDATAAPDGPPTHVDPPISPAQVLCAPLSRLVAVAVAFVALAFLAWFDGGRLLSGIDEPVERFVVERRTDTLDTIFRWISFCGSTRVVLTGGAVLALLAWRRCRVAALLVVAATLTRPPLEFTLKELVGRDRPSLDQMVDGVGHSFPSGHPMAAAALWLMVPVVLSLYTRSRRLWWVSVAASVAAVGLIGASRVYLDVHWATDVVGGILAAAMLLTGLDVAFRAVHGRRLCCGSPTDVAGATPGGARPPE